MAIVFDGTEKSYVDGLSGFLETRGRDSSCWVSDLRREGISGFSSLGFPAVSDEEWRFTNLSALSKLSFTVPPADAPELRAETADSFGFAGLECTRLVFVNGLFCRPLSSSEERDGTVVKSLSDALEQNGDLVRPHLAGYADYEKDPFISLNTSYFQDGAFVHVPDGAAPEKPVHVLHVTTGDAGSLFLNPRNLVVAGKSASASVVEHYVSLSDDVYFSNAVTEVVCAENSNVEHYRLEFASKKAFNFLTLRMDQKRDSNVASHSVLCGGAIVRNNVHPVLAGEGSNCDIYGLFVSEGRQHMDNFMRVEHASPRCDSRQFYNGVLDGRSRGVFHGRIIVHEGAEKTDAKQTNRNLLLSDSAQIDTKPQLEIYNDDVKCTHGATIGQMDEEALFYLRSRGVPERNARMVLLRAFTNQTLEHMSVGPVRESMESAVSGWFEKRLGG